MPAEIKFLIDFVHNFPIGIATADSTNRLPNSYNKFFIDMFGWDALEIDTLDKWFNKAFPNDAYREEVIEMWTNLIEETEKKQLLYSMPILGKVTCKDGSVKMCECRYYRKDNFIYGIFTDRTKEKIIEEKLISTSLVDELTNINNRKAYNQRIKEMLFLYQRNGTPFSILMFDIDNFKDINDNYGHHIGDKALIDMSMNVKNNIRENDYFFRIGGEEFVVILSGTKIEDSTLVAEKIRKNIELLKIVKNKVITVSIGLTEVTEHDTESSLYQRVDSLLYSSKKNGKNRISIS